MYSLFVTNPIIIWSVSTGNRVQGIWEPSVLSFQFFCKSKSVLKVNIW